MPATLALTHDLRHSGPWAPSSPRRPFQVATFLVCWVNRVPGALWHLCPHHPSGLHPQRRWEPGLGSRSEAGPRRGGEESCSWAELDLVLCLGESPGSKCVGAAWGRSAASFRRDSPTLGAAQSILGSPGPVAEAAKAGVKDAGGSGLCLLDQSSDDSRVEQLQKCQLLGASDLKLL